MYRVLWEFRGRKSRWVTAPRHRITMVSFLQVGSCSTKCGIRWIFGSVCVCFVFSKSIHLMYYIYIYSMNASRINDSCVRKVASLGIEVARSCLIDWVFLPRAAILVLCAYRALSRKISAWWVSMTWIAAVCENLRRVGEWLAVCWRPRSLNCYRFCIYIYTHLIGRII